MTESDAQKYLQRRASTDPRAVETLQQLGGVKQSTLERIASKAQEAQQSIPNWFLVVLPVPPSVNGMYRSTARGQRYLTEDAKAWKLEAARLVRAAHSLKTPYAGAVAVEVVVHPKDKRQFDIDNKLKCVLDALEDGGLIVNDAQVWDLRGIKKQPYPPSPRAVVMVIPMEAANE